MNIKPENPTKKDLIKGSPYLHPAVMFRREVILCVGGYSNKDYAKKRAQDYELFMRMASLNIILNVITIVQTILL
jgi:glycosyltransferase EpsE